MLDWQSWALCIMFPRDPKVTYLVYRIGLWNIESVRRIKIIEHV